MWEYYIEEDYEEEWEKHPTLNIWCSDKDRVKNHYKLLLGSKTTHGYIVIGINKVSYNKSDLIYEAFNELIDNGDVIDHKDGNKSNNNLDNLERVTQTENIRRAKNKKIYQFTKDRATFIKEFRSVKETESILNITSIKNCARGERNYAGKYYFSYERNLSKEIIEAGKKYRKIYQYSKDRKILKGEYEDASAAAKALGKNVTDIRKCADGDSRYSHAYKSYWSWTKIGIIYQYRDYKQNLVNDYENINEALKSINQPNGFNIISKSLEKDCEFVYGYYWSYIDYEYENSTIEEIN